MNITSIYFFLFSVLALGIYYLLPQRPQNYWLLLVSYAFIISWDWQFAFIFGVITIVNFLTAQRIVLNGSAQRVWLWFGIGFNLSVLIFFRTHNFFLPAVENLLARLGVTTQAGGLNILVPIGLSFYTLHNISYLIDVYRRRLNAETDWVNFALYSAYFPKILAGPIERAKTFLPKIAQPRLVDNLIFSHSVLLILVGIVRKLFIADVLSASILTDVFEMPAKYTPPELIGWLVIYAFALYNDFAGYTSIVRGVSGLFGIELSPNFNTPYFSRSFNEFWKRWHITLSEWLRDYIYFPLSRMLIRRKSNRVNLMNLVLPPMATMLVSGMWHGASLSMLLWGGMHGLYLIFEQILTLRRSRIPSQDQPVWQQGLAMLVVFMFVILAWVPFGWGLPTAFEFWGALFNWSSFAIRYRRLFLVVPIVLGSLVIDFLQYHSQDEFVFLKWPRLAQAVCIAMILILTFITTGGDFEQPFVYQAF